MVSEEASAADSPDERETLSAQMGRPLDGASRVVSRCELDLPVVIEVDPDQDGTPFPTLYYLVCPLARARVSRVEAAGGVRAFTERVQSDPEFAAAFATSQRAYAEARARLLPADSAVGPLLRGGVGGAANGVKCLHAHYAHGRAGGANPIAGELNPDVEPLNCAQPCVLNGRRNPAWREPSQR